MASIQIYDLQPTGFDLFNDSESFMNELTDNELVNTQGGDATTIILSVIGVLVAVTVIGSGVNQSAF